MVRNKKDTDDNSNCPNATTCSVNNNRQESKALDQSKVVEGKNGLMVMDPENNPTVVNAVAQIRRQFLEEYEANSELYIASDVKMISECDYYIRRFLYPHDLDPDAAYDQFCEWMAWRKRMGFEDASDQRFPMEFYQIGACFRYLPDKEGTLLMYCQFKVSDLSTSTGQTCLAAAAKSPFHLCK